MFIDWQSFEISKQNDKFVGISFFSDSEIKGGKCGNRGFEIGLTFIHQLCSRCLASETKVSVSFNFTNENSKTKWSSGQTSFLFPLASLYYQPVFVQPLKLVSPGNNNLSLCNQTATKITSIDLTLEQKMFYFIKLHALVIEYKCC